MKKKVPHSKTKHKKGYIKSLHRGLEVLQCFSSDNPNLSTTEISRKLALSKSTVYRYLSTLEDLGYLVQEDNTKRYRLTLKALDLGFSALSSLDYPDIALPYIEELAHQCQEAASMAVLEGSEIVYVARSATKRWMSTNLRVGSRLPAFCTSLGRALLAYRPFEEVRSLLDGKLTSYTPNTITDWEGLRKVLAQVRERGYAINDEELEIGLRSAAAPVRSTNGEVIASINISTSASRVSMEQLREDLIPLLLKTAEKITSALGYCHFNQK